MHSLLLFASLTLLGSGDVTPTTTPAPRPMASQPLTLLPRGVTSFGAAELDGWLYVFGGYHGEPHHYSKEGQSDAFYRINLRDPRQVEDLDGGIAVQGAPLAAWKGHLVRTGGMVASNSAGEEQDLHSLADAAWWDASTRTWSALPAMPRARSSHDMAVVGDQLVVVGGWTLDGKSKHAFLTDALLLDLGHPERGWTTIPAPFERRALAVAPLGDRVAVVGGMDSENDVTVSVELFDPAARTWSHGPDYPGAGFGVAAATVDGALFASGKDGVMWRLDAGASAWTRAGSLAFPRFFHRLVAGDDHDVLALGGIDDMRASGRVRHVERFAARDASVPSVAVYDLPAPFQARNRQGAFLRGNQLTLFGGNRSLAQHDFGREDFQSEAFVLDLATFAWKPIASFPEGRQTITSLVQSDGTTGLAVGGFGFVDGKAMARASGWRYSFESNAWNRAEGLDLPQPRTQFGMIENAGKLWLFGGLDYDPARDEPFVHPVSVLTCDLSDPAARFEDTGVRLESPRRSFGCAALNGKAYLVGGMREEFDVVPECESFDFATRKFAHIAAPARPRVGAELVALGDKLYLCGGSSRTEEGSLKPDGSIEVYDPAADKWSTLIEALPAPMLHQHAFAFRDRLLLVSSHIAGPPTTRIVFVTP